MNRMFSATPPARWTYLSTTLAGSCRSSARHMPRQSTLPRCSLTAPRTRTLASLLISEQHRHARWISHSYPRHEAATAEKHSQAPAATTSVDHQPPLPVRVALVSTTTALATPSFPALGFLYLVLRVTIPDANLRKAMEGRWGSLLSFTTWTLLPKLYHGTVASLILPCAVSNAIVAGGVYGLVDVACGGPNNTSSSLNKIMHTPALGSGIGASVGYIAPNYFYGPAMEYLYGLDGMSQHMQYAMSLPYATEVSVATGAVAGAILHPFLYSPMNGIAGLRWHYFSGVALATVTSALVYVYYGREEAGLPVPKGSYIDPSKLDTIDSIMRYNNMSGIVETYSLRKQNFIGSPDVCLEGQRIAKASRTYSKSGKLVFDDRALAFVYNFWDESNTRERYADHIVHIKKLADLQQMQNSMAASDALVAMILHNERNVTDKNGNGMAKILSDINGLNKGQELKPKLFEEVSAAVELLMITKLSKQDGLSIDGQVPTLEQFILRRLPEVTLYESDEKYEGESVESQLRSANWKGPEPSQAIHRWKEVHEEERFKTWRNRGLVVLATGALLSFAASMLQGSR